MSPSGSSTHLAVFAKYWEPGRVKTRLGTAVGHQAAAAIHREFLGELVHRFRETAAGRTLVFWPPEKRSEFQEFLPPNWGLTCQEQGDLGTKLSIFLQSRLVRQQERIVVIGADSPDLPQEFLAEAFRLLDTHEVVLGPSVDGGYYLVGMSSYAPIFSDIAWGTASVLPQTVEQLRRQAVNFAVLKNWEDVDDWQSLQSLLRRLQLTNPDPEQTRLLARVQAILRTVSK